MRPEALAKLDLLAAAKEATLQETLERHTKALQHYEAQRTVLMGYQARLTAGWRNGAMVPAGDAARATKFVAQAEVARQHLAQSIKAEQDKQTECTIALASLRKRRETLQERLKVARRVTLEQAQTREERSRPVFRPSPADDESLF